MKYLKLFEDNNKKEELEELIPEIEDLCQDLKDRGFTIKIDYAKVTPFEYTKFRSDKKIRETYIDGIYIAINKYKYKNRDFYIKDIKNDLLFIESYIVGELDLKVNYYYTDFKNKDGLYIIEYYKNIEDLSLNVKTDFVHICFIKA